MTAADGQLTAGQLDVALAQYREMRVEINHWSQAKTALIALALTATSAIGSFGLSATSHKEALLILPFVLSGLALIYLNYSVFAKTSGDYIREELWPFLRRLLSAPGDDPRLQLPDWETWIDDPSQKRPRFSPAGLLTILGQGIVFGVPAIAALIITLHLAWSHTWAAIWWIWWLGLLALAGTIAMIIVVEHCVLNPADRSEDRADPSL
jgi:hypothetical protein